MLSNHSEFVYAMAKCEEDQLALQVNQIRTDLMELHCIGNGLYDMESEASSQDNLAISQ